MSESRVQLRRDTVNTAWGFRLQGGHEYSGPLVVQRVFSGSPADGHLQRGDVFLSINNHDVSRMQQKQAEDIIRAAGSALSLVIKRTGAGTQHEDSLLTFANEPRSQQASWRSFDNAVKQSTPPAAAPTAHRGPSHHDGPRLPSTTTTTQSKKPSAMIWSPSGGGGGGQASYGPGGQVGDISSHQHVPAPRPTPASVAHPQFSTDVDYAGHGGGAPWRARDGGGGGGTWNQSQRGPAAAASSQHQHQQQQQQQQQRGRAQAQREYANHGHPPKTSPGVSDESRMVAVQVIKSMNQQDDDDDMYEPKSVREIKAMFNKPSKPAVPKQQQRPSNKPWMMQDNAPPAPPAMSPSTPPSWSSPSHDKYAQFPSQTKTFSPAPASQPVHERTSILQQHADLIASYPAPRQKPAPPAQLTGLIKPTASSAPKPGAGYSYQGMANVTPAKPVHKHGSASGGGGGGSKSTAGKKKEFDPSQSLVYAMLQEESERAKRGGDVDEPAEEEPNFRRQPQQQQQQQQPQQQWQQQQQRRRPQAQQGSRLQDLLERDRAASQQQEEDEPMQQGGDMRPSQQAQQPSAALQSQPRQPVATHHNQQRMRPHQQQPAAAMHQESTYMKGSPSASGHYHQQQQPMSPSYEYYQQAAPTRGGHYQNAPGYHMAAGYQSYGQESVPVSDF